MPSAGQQRFDTHECVRRRRDAHQSRAGVAAILKKPAADTDATGIAVFDGEKLVAVDLFHCRKVFVGLQPKLLRSYAPKSRGPPSLGQRRTRRPRATGSSTSSARAFEAPTANEIHGRRESQWSLRPPEFCGVRSYANDGVLSAPQCLAARLEVASQVSRAGRRRHPRPLHCANAPARPGPLHFFLAIAACASRESEEPGAAHRPRRRADSRPDASLLRRPWSHCWHWLGARADGFAHEYAGRYLGSGGDAQDANRFDRWLRSRRYRPRHPPGPHHLERL